MIAEAGQNQERVEVWPEAPDGRSVVLHTRVVTESGGGPDKTILNSASHFQDSPYWLAAAYMHPPDDAGFDAVRKRADEADCPLIPVADRGPLDRSVVRSLYNICKHYDVKVWHAHDYKSNLLGLSLRPFHAMKLVTTVHGWVRHTTRTPLYYAVDRLCLPYYHHVICVSDDLRDRAVKVGVAPERCTMIPNAIDHLRFTRRYPQSESHLRRELGVPPERLVIGAVGRLSAEKGFTDLIRAAHTLLDEGVDLELWIAGEGEQYAALAEMIDKLSLSGRVRLLGFCGDTIGLYHALDLFVLSSLREGLPNVILEAAAMQTPIVSTRVAQVPLMLTDGETGLLCDMGNVDQLTAAMRRALGDADLRRHLAQAGRALIERQYTFAQRMAKVRAIYDSLDAGVSQASPAVAAAG